MWDGLYQTSPRFEFVSNKSLVVVNFDEFSADQWEEPDTTHYGRELRSISV